MKIWVDDVRPAPFGYRWIRSVNEAIQTICNYELMYRASGGKEFYFIELIDLDHDAGDYAKDGGDYIKLLDWLVETKRFYPVKLHTMNPVGRENMQRMIDKDGDNIVLFIIITSHTAPRIPSSHIAIFVPINGHTHLFTVIRVSILSVPLAIELNVRA